MVITDVCLLGDLNAGVGDLNISSAVSEFVVAVVKQSVM